MEIKVPFYHVVNMFLTGLVLLGGGIMLFPDVATSFLGNSFITRASVGPEIVGVICLAAISYEVGLIVNRIGSVILEPILRKLKMIPFDNDYVKYNRVKMRFQIMETLSREYSLSRTGIALFIILAIMALFSSTKLFAIPLAAIAVVYLVSCRKHAARIVALMAMPMDKEDSANAEKDAIHGS